MGDLGQDIKQNPWALPSALALGGSAGLLRSGGLIGTPVGAVLGGLGAYGLGYGERSSQRKSQQKLADALKNIDPNATYPQIVQTVVGGGGDLKDADEFWKGMHPKDTPDHRELVRVPGQPLGSYDTTTNTYAAVPNAPTIPKLDKTAAPGSLGDFIAKHPELTPLQAKAQWDQAGRNPEKPRYTFQPDGKGGFVRIDEDTLKTTPIAGVTKPPADKSKIAKPPTILKGVFGVNYLPLQKQPDGSMIYRVDPLSVGMAEKVRAATGYPPRFPQFVRFNPDGTIKAVAPAASAPSPLAPAMAAH